MFTTRRDIDDDDSSRSRLNQLNLRLNAAAAEGDTDGVVTAITDGADINAAVSVVSTSKDKKTPLMNAARKGKVAEVRQLLDMASSLPSTPC